MPKKKTVKKKSARRNRSKINLRPMIGVSLNNSAEKAFETIVNEFELQLGRYAGYASETHGLLNKVRNDGERNEKCDTPPVADLLSKFGELNYRFMKLNDLHEANLTKLNTLI